MDFTDYSAALVAEATDALYRELDLATQRREASGNSLAKRTSRVRRLQADLLKAEQFERDERVTDTTRELGYASALISSIERQLAALDAPGTKQQETVQMLEFMQENVESHARELLDYLAALAVDQGQADVLAADTDF